MSAKKVYRFKAYNGVALLPSQISKSLQIVLLYIDKLKAGCIGAYIIVLFTELKDFCWKSIFLSWS